ncbi:MAG: Fe-S cluster assembly protein SufD [Alphaproteobacteria bacterium]|nr:Fe-S cluster assembly protein SufD [Alphaproteobacteria bacterium]MBM3625697.1 Fe-S cluster assembly protein SufD [Alphaproteobacteria bacterium]MBM3640485.1 Fe-S cluster assembly protein SufD [Alphaproteobacteria bacterium]
MNHAPATPTRKLTDAEVRLAEIFAARQSAGGPQLATLRTAAFDAFSKTGLPNRHDEAWRYTDLRALLRDVKPLAAPPEESAAHSMREAAVLPGVASRRIVFVDGYFIAALSDLDNLEKGLSVASLSEALAKGDAATTALLGKVGKVDDPAFALNTAFMGEGVVIRVGADRSIERPIQLVFVAGAQPATYFLRSLVVIEKGARATLIESFEGSTTQQYHVNAATEVVLEEGASLERLKISREGDAAMHVSTFVASLAANARLSDVGLNLGGALLRNQSFVCLKGQEAHAAVRGANILKNKEHADATLFLEHEAERSESRALFKSVLEDSSQAVFQGKILVGPGAQKTDARMMARALLLSEGAQANCKPELEIFADDVQCAHGSTVGALDENLVFYLMARGIGRTEAEALLTEAFIGEVIDPVENRSVREALGALVSDRLRARK